MKKHSIFFSTAILCCLFIFSACNQPQGGGAATSEKAKDIYLQLYSVRDDIRADYNGTIATVAEMGYTGVEAAGYSDGLFYEMSPAAFKQSIEAAGMEVLSSHAGRPLESPASDTDWDDIWAWWDTAIQAHQEAGMKYIIIPWIPTPSTLVDLQAYCDYFNEVGDRCNAAGMKFGYHNHNFEFNEIEGEIMYDYMLNNTDRNKVFFQMDVYWVLQGGYDPVDYMNNYAGRFEVLHIKDELEIGRSGEVDFEAIYNNARVAGAKYMVVEVERYTGTPFDGVKESYDYLNNADFVLDTYSN